MNILRLEKTVGDETYIMYCEDRDADILRLAVKVGYAVTESVPYDSLEQEGHVCDENCPKEGPAEKAPALESPEPEVLKEKKAPTRRVTKSKK